MGVALEIHTAAETAIGRRIRTRRDALSICAEAPLGTRLRTSPAVQEIRLEVDATLAASGISFFAPTGALDATFARFTGFSASAAVGGIGARIETTAKAKRRCQRRTGSHTPTPRAKLAFATTAPAAPAVFRITLYINTETTAKRQDAITDALALTTKLLFTAYAAA